MVTIEVMKIRDSRTHAAQGRVAHRRGGGDGMSMYIAMDVGKRCRLDVARPLEGAKVTSGSQVPAGQARPSPQPLPLSLFRSNVVDAQDRGDH